MPNSIHVLSLSMPFHMGSVNCYLLNGEAGFYLIDTGAPNNRRILAKGLEQHGCQPGMLKLTILTHGDFDHTGNAAFLRSEFGSHIAMHESDAAMAASGDMFANRSRSNSIIKVLAPRLIGFGLAEHFSPDLLLKDGDALSAYGVDAHVLSIPGHSPGSIGILTAEGDFFCGDLMVNSKRPTLNRLVDDRAAMESSLAMLQDHSIRMVYPGHGDPFTLDQLKYS